MKVWGIGTNDIREFPLRKDYIRIDWDKEAAPDLHVMFRQIQVNDIVYVKAFLRNGRVLRVKAIGIVTQSAHKQEETENMVVTVLWLDVFTKDPLDISLNDCNLKNNVYSNTLYQEYSPQIIEKIMKRYSSDILESVNEPVDKLHKEQH
ncbi:MAG TPA: hypothetical protein DD391_10505 [Clostridiales bacterium]|jgi:hypothetical protein|nr:hypothetical protein [Clostridiales bacterium]HBL82995.1 hypothetical protein [Clostridiales bacterium]